VQNSLTSTVAPGQTRFMGRAVGVVHPKDYDYKEKFARYTLFAHLLFVAVFPNAFREFKIATYALSSIVILGFAWNYPSLLARVFAVIFLCAHSFGILKGYLAVGSAFIQYVAPAYLVGPIFWYLFSNALFAVTPAGLLRRFLIGCYLFTATVVVLFSVFYDSIPFEIKEMVIKDPNKSYAEGVSIVRLHATGSLMFLFPFALVALHRTRYLYPFLAVLGIIASVLTGRTGLIIGAVGAICIFSVIQRQLTAIFAIAGGIVLIIASNSLNLVSTDLNWANIVDDHVSKFISRGGDERPEQRQELISEFLDAPIFGKGHGMTTAVLRDTEKPWRYELLYEATLFRVGLLGFLATFLPIVWMLVRLTLHSMAFKSDKLGIAIYIGALAAFIGSGTNPYYEAIDFQWMVMLPIAYAIRCGPMRPNMRESSKP